MTWEVQKAYFGDLDYDQLLADGWEPFAVSSTDTVWFRRQMVKVPDEA